MVVNEKVLASLAASGLSEYEARAYLALLGKHPASAYEVASASGIPTSKVYEVARKLSQKGIISALEGKGTKRYIPVEPEDFINRLRTATESNLNTLSTELSSLKAGPDASYIWNIADAAGLVEGAGRLVRGAMRTLLLSIWREEMALLEGDLMAAAERGVRVAAIHYGPISTRVKGLFQHPVQDSIYAEKGGRGLVVVADSGEALLGTFQKGGGASGARSRNSGFVMLAEDYIRHDIYMMKVVRRFDHEMRERFGQGYELMTDIFSDQEAGPQPG